MTEQKKRKLFARDGGCGGKAIVITDHGGLSQLGIVQKRKRITCGNAFKEKD